MINKDIILNNICYTELVYERINKKLNENLSKLEAEKLISKIISETDIKCFKKKGKNIYVENTDKNISVTINQNSYRIITVDRIRLANK